jgi:hypothetical protein
VRLEFRFIEENSTIKLTEVTFNNCTRFLWSKGKGGGGGQGGGRWNCLGN